MRGGFSNKVTVKYEKIPLFRFHCGRLGHGTKDCDEFHGEGSPTKNINGGLKASPWRPIRENDDDAEGADKSCRARKLFIVKSADTSHSFPLKGKVEAVDKLLDHVDINSNDQEDHFDPHRGGVNHALGESLNQSTDYEVYADGVFIPADIPKGEAMPSVAVIETRN